MASTPMVKAKNTSDSHAEKRPPGRRNFDFLWREGNFLRYIR